jgi:hypothetical protein
VSNYTYGNGAYGTSKVSLGPVYGKFEHGFLRDDIGLGGQIAMSNTWVKYNTPTGSYRDFVTAFSVGLLGYYHFNKLIPVARLDVYAGAGVSVRTITYSYDSDFPNHPNNNSSTDVYLIGKMGARYYVTPGVGIYVEVGYDRMSDANLGVSFRL